MLVLGASQALLDKADVPVKLSDGTDDPGLTVAADDMAGAIAAFIHGIAKHRHPERETDPPLV